MFNEDANKTIYVSFKSYNWGKKQKYNLTIKYYSSTYPNEKYF